MQSFAFAQHGSPSVALTAPACMRHFWELCSEVRSLAVAWIFAEDWLQPPWGPIWRNKFACKASNCNGLCTKASLQELGRTSLDAECWANEFERSQFDAGSIFYAGVHSQTVQGNNSPSMVACSMHTCSLDCHELTERPSLQDLRCEDFTARRSLPNFHCKAYTATCCVRQAMAC
jgi:hypothetical protein